MDPKIKAALDALLKALGPILIAMLQALLTKADPTKSHPLSVAVGAIHDAEAELAQ